MWPSSHHMALNDLLHRTRLLVPSLPSHNNSLVQYQHQMARATHRMSLNAQMSGGHGLADGPKAIAYKNEKTSWDGEYVLPCRNC